jgi:predicted metal-dependent HD superfamily phosphohydrolase
VVSTSAIASETELLPDLLTAWRAHVSDDTIPLGHLIERHRDPSRHYHGVAHLCAVVATALDLIEAGSLGSDPVEDSGTVVAAAFFHDAVYDVSASDNEARSAELARRNLRTLGWADRRVERVTVMIERTVDHRDPPDADFATLFDADLAILGSETSVYGRYVDAVRSEYSTVPDDAWRTGRTVVLSAFLDRRSIFATTVGIDRWESAARSNLERELGSLRE